MYQKLGPFILFGRRLFPGNFIILVCFFFIVGIFILDPRHEAGSEDPASVGRSLPHTSSGVSRPNMEVFRDEIEMIKAFADTVLKHDPDILIGYEAIFFYKIKSRGLDIFFPRNSFQLRGAAVFLGLSHRAECSPGHEPAPAHLQAAEFREGQQDGPRTRCVRSLFIQSLN